MKVPEKKGTFAVQVLWDHTVIQVVIMNKTNQLSIYLASEETTFDLAAKFEGLTTNHVIQSELDTFLTWEFLTNENILRILKNTNVT